LGINKYTLYNDCNNGTYFGTYEIIDDFFILKIKGVIESSNKIEIFSNDKFVVSDVIDGVKWLETYIRIR
jgi:hypothetical protein